MRKTISVLILVSVLLYCAPDRSARAPAGTQILTLEHDGLERGCGIHIPELYDGRNRVPLVVALHCYSIDGSIFMKRTGWVEKSEEHGFLLAFPDATGEPSEWNDGIGLTASTRDVDDLGFVSGLIEEIVKDYQIDKKRVYVAGHSSGSFLAHQLAAVHSDLITAIGAVAGQGTQTRLDGLRPRRPVAVVHFHALDDPSVPFFGSVVNGIPCPPVMDVMGAWARVNGCADQPDTTILSGGLLGLRWKADGTHGDVLLYRLDAGGHGWPVQPVSATDLMWTFFKEHAVQ